MVCVGRIDPAKGVHLLVDAFLREDRSPLKLVIVGDASGKDDYITGLRRHEGDRVVFLGHQEGDVLRALYDHSRLFVLPSYAEGLPIVLLEALASSCELVYSDLRPNIEVAQGLGRTFRCGDVDDLADILDRALAEPTGDAQAAELVARRLREYDWDRIVDAYLDSYRQAVAHRRGAPDESVRASAGGDSVGG